MNEDEFLLKWNNHQTNFVDVFNHLLRDDSFVDVTLVCGGEAVLGHKMVLAACSPLLYRILRDNPCKHPVLILSDVPAGDMRAMMKFIYQGEVSVSQSELASFLKTADNLQIKGLAEDRERDKEHRSKDERKRKDKDDRTEGTRPSHKRQRLSDVRPAAAADNYSPLLSGSHKLVSDSHSSHKVRSKASSSSSSASSPDEHLIKCGGSGNTGSSTHLTSTSKHISSETLSSKVIHGISGKVCNSSKESASLSNANGDTLLLKTSERENMTIKMEPMDYPGEVMWTEGHSAISSDILDDPQPLIPLGAITTTLEGVPVTVAASPNLPVLDANDDGQCDEESREEVSADDINANTTMMKPDEVEDESTTTGSSSKFRGGRKACCFCGKTFCDNYTLRRHMVTHLSRERQFECPMCSAAYSRKDHLMAHIRRKHPISDGSVGKLEYNVKLEYNAGQASLSTAP